MGTGALFQELHETILTIWDLSRYTYYIIDQANNEQMKDIIRLFIQTIPFSNQSNNTNCFYQTISWNIICHHYKNFPSNSTRKRQKHLHTSCFFPAYLTVSNACSAYPVADFAAVVANSQLNHYASPTQTHQNRRNCFPWDCACATATKDYHSSGRRSGASGDYLMRLAQGDDCQRGVIEH